jgi:hypothetical protein
MQKTSQTINIALYQQNDEDLAIFPSDLEDY